MLGRLHFCSRKTGVLLPPPKKPEAKGSGPLKPNSKHVTQMYQTSFFLIQNGEVWRNVSLKHSIKSLSIVIKKYRESIDVLVTDYFCAHLKY